MPRPVTASLLLSIFYAAPSLAQDTSAVGAVSTPNPTLEHISIEWPFSGDDNEDGSVALRFREVGAGTWRVGHRLFRVPAGSNVGHSWTQRHAGSVFGLAPGTNYEIELTLSDPDGGGTTRTAMVSTCPVPRIAAGTPSTIVNPASIAAAIARRCFRA